MTLGDFYILVGSAFFIRIFPLPKIRKWILLVASIILIFWLQPALPIRYLDFYLPILTIIIILLSWWLLSNHESHRNPENLVAFGVILVTIIIVNLTRYFSLAGILTPSRPPSFLFLGMMIFLTVAVGFLVRKQNWQNKKIWVAGFIVFLLLLIVLKNPDLRILVSKSLRSIQNQNVDFASGFDIQWLGFSYVIFRLIHTIKDLQNKRLTGVSLITYINYVLFFPTFIAGPIDRIQHFQNEFQLESKLKTQEIGGSVWRLVLGVFKKFAVADTLAIIALNANILPQFNSTGFIWLAVYAYAFMILFDFSGYTDIAIGTGVLLGIQLPENFQTPYLKPNIKLFWDNWHMTLTQWFRTYYFNPVSRKIRRKWRKMPVGMMVLIMQLSTMLLIGLWHGVTWNYVLWGLWHGLGLFLFNRWNEWFSPRLEKNNNRLIQKIIPIGGVLLTFHFVALGWVWFALPSVPQSVDVFLRLFGG